MPEDLARRILIPLDGSPHSETILSRIERFASSETMSIVLVQAVPFFDDVGKDEAESYLRERARRLTRDGWPATFAVRIGAAAPAIQEIAAERRSTMITLATHGRSGIERWVIGSVAEEVLESSRIPVLLVRSFAPPGSATSIRNILLPLDGDPRSLDVLDPVISLARTRNVRVRLLEVDDPTPAPGHWDCPGETAGRADRILRDACIPTLFERRRGKPGEEILTAAADHPTDLIAMSTHGRSGPARVFLGSVTEDVLRHARVPLLAIRRGPAESSGKNAAVPADIPASPRLPS